MPNQAPKAKVPHAFKNKKVACILEPLENQTKPAATKQSPSVPATAAAQESSASAYPYLHAVTFIFTIGPSCQDVDTLADILVNGGTCARIDLTWGSLPFHMQSLRNLGKAMLKTRKLCAVMVDTLGREVFVRREFTLGDDDWPKHGSAVQVKTGGQIKLVMDPDAKQTDTVFPINYPKLAEMVEVGDLLYIGRYLVTGADSASLYLEVQSKTVTEIVCVAHNDANLDGLLTVFHMERSDKGITNKPNKQDLLSTQDVEWMKAIVAEFDVDFLSLSYTRDSHDVHEARTFLNEMGLEHCKIIAKLDAKQSLINFRGILSAADGIMLSRGNLGLDCLPEKIAVIQKNVTTSCNLVGKPCIVSRIMDSMVNAPRPTRAEATDVANAVLDGADCLMLGAETLRGLDPANAVSTVVSCCLAAELEFNHTQHFDYLMREAMKAEDVGIMVPGGNDADESVSPDGSSHGTAEALATIQGGSTNGSIASGLGTSGQGGVAPTSKLASSYSHASLQTSLKAMTRQAPSSANLFSAMGGLSSGLNLHGAGEDAKIHMSFLSKLEALASSSVRVAEKAAAKLLIVFTDTGLTSALVAKYRPTVPILTLVIPRLVNQDLQWRIIGRHVARQCLITRGLQPMLAAPSPDGERVLRDAVKAATARGLLGAGDHAVCVEKISGDYCIKMVSVDDAGIDVKEVEPLAAPQQLASLTA